ncbi:MAG TPA: hypothetical protein VHB21_01860, partial [Minicystis sp.]|nr:hypothetical protein [Minicystis sp.]
MRTRIFLFGALAAPLACGCAARDSIWDTPPVTTAELGLGDAVVVVDGEAARAVVLSIADGSLGLATTSVPIGRGFAASATTTDLAKALVLTRGDPSPEGVDDETPTLSVLAGGAAPGLATAYPLSDPLSGLAVDPLGRYAVVYTAPGDSEFVSNPNELLVVDLTAPPGADNPTPITLRSFGGTPQRFTFTEPLDLPGGQTRLLVVETDRDVSLLDLGDLAAGDVTVRLSSTADAPTPAQIAVTDGDPAKPDDARLAVRLEGQSSVVFVDLAPTPPGQHAGAHPFLPTPNEVFVGAEPSDVAFVKTDGGLRLAALVPTKRALTLADPDTGLTSDVALDAPYQHMSIVTDEVGSASGADVALLWSDQSTEVAFVALGSTVGKPYRSVDTLSLPEPVASVVVVPAPNDRRKIMSLVGGETYSVLDLVDRTQSPILASQGSRLTVSPDGERAWVTATGTGEIAMLDLATLHPQNLTLTNTVSGAFDVRRGDGGRALVALHEGGALDVTVVDGVTPSVATAKEYVGVL